MSRPYGLGRIYIEDQRDALYPYPFTTALTAHMSKFWWSDGWWGNQGQDPHCVAYAWAHILADGPHLKSVFTTTIDTEKLYCEAKKRDPWPGDCDNPLYDGTSVRAGAQVLKDWGYIEEYRWATNADQAAHAVLTRGPIVAGTFWHWDMFFPNAEGIIRPTGRTVGGHAYLLNGVDMEKGLFRIKNSWGQEWGRGGHALISMEDMDSLIRRFGEACIPLQTRIEL